MKYSFDIFDKNPERLAKMLAENARKRRLDKGLSRRSLSERTGIPEPTLERFETKGKISLEALENHMPSEKRLIIADIGLLESLWQIVQYN